MKRTKNCLAKLDRMNKALNYKESDRVPISDFFWGSFVRNRSMNFSSLVGILFTVFISGFLSCSNNKIAIETNIKPNIIFLLADDQRDNTFSGLGHPFVKTPHIDKLLKQGTRFSNTYIAEPVCSPSRVSLLTGMHERIHGVGFSSSYQLTEEQWNKTYPAILRENGYFTGFIGKFGVEYYTFKGKTSDKFDFWFAHDGWTKFFPKDFNLNSCKPYHEAENDIITPIMGEGIDLFLDNVPKEKSFCLSVSFNVPHGSQTTSMNTGYEEWKQMLRPANENPNLKGTEFYDNLYRDLNVTIPPETGKDAYQFIPKSILNQDKGRNKTYSYDYTVETTNEHHIRYYQTISGMDKVVGDLMEKLEECGLAKNTVIIYGSDNGLLMGEYGMGGKGLLYDLSSKIPCFIYDPRLPDTQKGKTVDKLVSSLDIPVTIMDYAGFEAPREMTGNSLIPLVEGKDTEWRNELFLESLFTLRDNPFCEGIRVGDWKYIRMFDGVNSYCENDVNFKGRTPDYEQLFDLSRDPEEKINLIGKYDNTEFIDSLRNKVSGYSIEMNANRTNYMKTHLVSKRK